MLFVLLCLPFFLFGETWAEKTLAHMTLDQKIGQLFVAPFCPPRGEDHWNDWEDMIGQFSIGNAIVKHSDPLTQVRRLNQIQDLSALPLLIAADAEWGLAMRMKETMAFPKNRLLGKIENLDLLYRCGAEIGRQAKRVGIHLNLAPVADVDSNPDNPIIGIRSFGPDPKRVADCVEAMVLGMQSQGILACAKHFPGHGDTSVDSHRGLPLVGHKRGRLDAVEFVPFRKAIECGVETIMTGHLLVPAIDPDLPATLSPKVLQGLLRNEFGFQGLIIADALNMAALKESPEKIAVLAFTAGCDLLLYGDHIAPNIDHLLRSEIPKAWRALKQAFVDGTLSLQELDARVFKILSAKEKLGLHKSTAISEEGLYEALHTEDACRLREALLPYMDLLP